MPDGLSGIEKLRADALYLYNAAIKAVDGRRCVAAVLGRLPMHGPIHLVAIGKAAAAMTEGACQVVDGGIASGLVITKHGHACEDRQHDGRFTVLESDHPIPGKASLEAGVSLLRFLEAAPADARFLFLLSGGASSLVEVLPASVTFADYQRANTWLLGSGLDIHRINAVRKQLSMIKGGKLRRSLRGRDARCLLISDVPGDDPASIGSGLLVAEDNSYLDHLGSDLPDWLQSCMGAAAATDDTAIPSTTISHEVIADNRKARAAACTAAQKLGYPVVDHTDLLVGDALVAARHCAQEVLQGSIGVTVWGGETTLKLPDQPGRGGRSQSFALAAAMVLADHEYCVVLAAGSDGTDGPTEDAGALVDGGTLKRGEAEALSAADCLARADAGAFLAASGDLIQTGPTGTNVMDLVIGIKRHQ